MEKKGGGGSVRGGLLQTGKDQRNASQAAAATREVGIGVLLDTQRPKTISVGMLMPCYVESRPVCWRGAIRAAESHYSTWVEVETLLSPTLLVA